MKLAAEANTLRSISAPTAVKAFKFYHQPPYSFQIVSQFARFHQSPLYREEDCRYFRIFLYQILAPLGTVTVTRHRIYQGSS